MKKSGILVLVFTLLVQYNAFATSNDEIVQRPIRTIDDTAQDEDRTAVLEKEIQGLLGRVEVLEHIVSQLSQHVQVSAQALPKIAVPSDVVPVPSVKHVAQADDVAIAPVEADTEKKMYDRALIAIKEGRYDEAETKFADFIAKYPKSSLVSNAYFWYGETYFKRNDYENAALQYLKCYKNFPKSAKAADSLLKLALSLGEMKKKKEACAMLMKLEKEFKDRPASSIKRAKDAINKYGCK